MTADELKDRTRKFALRIIRMTGALPRNRVADILGRQVIRSGTSVGANYRAACRAKSRPDFISKLGTVEEECDETVYWLDLLADSGLLKRSRLQSLIDEGNELLKIIVTSSKTARSKLNPQSAIRNPQ